MNRYLRPLLTVALLAAAAPTFADPPSFVPVGPGYQPPGFVPEGPGYQQPGYYPDDAQDYDPAGAPGYGPQQPPVYGPGNPAGWQGDPTQYYGPAGPAQGYGPYGPTGPQGYGPYGPYGQQGPSTFVGPVQPQGWNGFHGPKVTCADGVLKMFIPAAELTPRINEYLNKHAAGCLHQSDTQVAEVHDFHATLHHDVINVRFDYKIKQRGYTKGPFGTKIEGPWISDTGWGEVDVKAEVENWTLRVHTHKDFVRWGAKNWFTALVHDMFDDHIRDHLVNSVTEAVAASLGSGRTMNLEPLFIKQGAPQLAAAYGLSQEQARVWLTQTLGKLKVRAELEEAGLWAVVPLNMGIYAKNDHHEPIKLAVRCMGLNGQWATQGWFTIPPGSGMFLTDHGKRILPGDTKVYYFAEGQGEEGHKWHGEHEHEHDGQTLPMRASDLIMAEDGRYMLYIK
jgi:hypothetical protein